MTIRKTKKFEKLKLRYRHMYGRYHGRLGWDRLVPVLDWTPLLGRHKRRASIRFMIRSGAFPV